MPSGQIRVGISGWTYARWRGDFYPTGLPHSRELAYAAERMTSVRSTAPSSLQRPTSYARWREATARRLRVRVKGSRFITREAALVDIDVALANFWASGVLARRTARPRSGSCRPGSGSTPPGWRTSSTDSPAPRPRRLVWRGRMTRRSRSPAPWSTPWTSGRSATSWSRGTSASPPRSGGPVAGQRHRYGAWADAAGHFPVIDADTSGAVRAAARAYRARQWVQLALSRPVGATVPRVGGGRAGRVRLLRQRRPRTRAWDAVGLLERLGR